MSTLGKRVDKLERETVGREGIGADRVIAIERYCVTPGLLDQRTLIYRRDLVDGTWWWAADNESDKAPR